MNPPIKFFKFTPGHKIGALRPIYSIRKQYAIYWDYFQAENIQTACKHLERLEIDSTTMWASSTERFWTVQLLQNSKYLRHLKVNIGRCRSKNATTLIYQNWNYFHHFKASASVICLAHRMRCCKWFPATVSPFDDFHSNT
jgi:hypothetical protein